MTSFVGPTAIPDVAPETPIPLRPAEQGADRAFRVILTLCGATVLVLLAAIVVFLCVKGWPALREGGVGFFTGKVWAPDDHKFGVLPLLLGSVAIAMVSIVIATPVSFATALMINEYAPPRLRPILVSTVDILATIPSIVYGFWGLEVVSNWQAGPAQWLGTYFGFIPFLRTPSPGSFVKSVFATGLICALTIIPIITSVSREVMAQTPRDACEAALGLGGTRWGMITDVILPFSRGGMVGAVLLGVGRGLGETMIVVLVLSSAKLVTPYLLGPNGLGSVAAEITRFFADGSSIEKSALILAGLALFGTTLAVNAIARTIVRRVEAQVR
jgi:phosphate transport system permease protein